MRPPLSTARCILAAALLSSGWAVPAVARLGETMGEIKKYMGRPEAQTGKGSAFWLIEATDGQLAYTVTFNAKGKSIAEGLKPVKRAKLTPEMAQDFLATQLGPLQDSPTLRVSHPGEKYRFAGQDFVCGDGENAWVDEANGILLVWMRGASSIMAVSREMLQGK